MDVSTELENDYRMVNKFLYHWRNVIKLLHFVVVIAEIILLIWVISFVVGEKDIVDEWAAGNDYIRPQFLYCSTLPELDYYHRESDGGFQYVDYNRYGEDFLTNNC